MLSIDEAIEDFKTMANDARGEIIHGDDLEPQEKYYNSQIELCVKEKEQIATWLEELKALREEKSDFQIMAKDIAEGNYEMGMESGYRKAIDDAKSVILQTLDNEILVDTLHLRLEQLKEQICQ